MPYSNSWTTSFPQRRTTSYSPEVKSSLDVINKYIKGERLIEEVDPTTAWSVRSSLERNKAMSLQQEKLLGSNSGHGSWPVGRLEMPSPSLSNPNVVDPNASFRSLSPPRTGIPGQQYPPLNVVAMDQKVAPQPSPAQQPVSVPATVSQSDIRSRLTLIDVVDFLRWHYSNDTAAEESQLSVGNGIATLSEEDIISLTSCFTEELLQMKQGSILEQSQVQHPQQPKSQQSVQHSFNADDEFNRSAVITRTDIVQRSVEELPLRKPSSSSVGVQATPPTAPKEVSKPTIPPLQKDVLSSESDFSSSEEVVVAGNATREPSQESSGPTAATPAPVVVPPSAFPSKGKVPAGPARSRSLSLGKKIPPSPGVVIQSPLPSNVPVGGPSQPIQSQRKAAPKVDPATGSTSQPVPSPMAVPPELRIDPTPVKITTPSGLPAGPPAGSAPPPPQVVAPPIVGPSPEAVQKELQSLFYKLQPALDVTKFHERPSLRRLGRGKRWLKVENTNQKPVLLISKKAKFDHPDTYRWKLQALRQVSRGGVGSSWNAHRRSDGEYLRGVTSEEYLSPENCFSLIFGLPNNSAKQFNFYCGSKDKLQTWCRFFELTVLQNDRMRLLTR